MVKAQFERECDNIHPIIILQVEELFIIWINETNSEQTFTSIVYESQGLRYAM